MPEMIVSLDSSSTRARNVGSSFVNRWSAFPIRLRLLVLRLDAQVDYRFGHVHRRHRVADLIGGERVARSAVHTEQRDDVSGSGVLDVLHFVRVHPHEPADPHLAPGAPVDDRVPLSQLPLVDTNVCQLAEATLLELERESDERRIEVGVEGNFLFAESTPSRRVLATK